MSRDLDFYLNQRYVISLVQLSSDDGGGWLAEIPELPGCMSDGNTPDEALASLTDAKRVWLSSALTRGLTIPMPVDRTEEYSGRVTLRMPRSLHHKLADLARREDISLNQLMLSMLSHKTGAFEALVDDAVFERKGRYGRARETESTGRPREGSSSRCPDTGEKGR